MLVALNGYQRERLAEFQHRWFEQRFGYGDEAGLARALEDARWVIDAGTGPGIQAARLSRVTPAEGVGMDLSESVVRARRSLGSGRRSTKARRSRSSSSLEVA